MLLYALLHPVSMENHQSIIRFPVEMPDIGMKTNIIQANFITGFTLPPKAKLCLTVLNYRLRRTFLKVASEVLVGSIRIPIPFWEYFDRGPNLYKSSRVKEALCRYCVDKNGEKTILRGNYAGMYSHVITGKKFDKSVSLTISESFGNWYQI